MYTPDYDLKDTDILATSRMTPQPGVPPEECGAAVVADSKDTQPQKDIFYTVGDWLKRHRYLFVGWAKIFAWFALWVFASVFYPNPSYGASGNNNKWSLRPLPVGQSVFSITEPSQNHFLTPRSAAYLSDNANYFVTSRFDPDRNTLLVEYSNSSRIRILNVTSLGASLFNNPPEIETVYFDNR